MIPVVKALLVAGCRVTLAANGPQKHLLGEAFPGLECLSPPDYQVKYRKNRAATIASLVLAIPRLQSVIGQETAWLAKTLEQRQFDLIISDNRYGFYHTTVPSVFITHQLRPRTAFGSRVDGMLQRRLYAYIDRFTECWVPDFAAAPGLAGALSHPALLPRLPVRYLGRLSRLGALPPPSDELDTLAILSGPEPQRTILENSLLQYWQQHPGKKRMLVRGLPGQAARQDGPPGVVICNHLPAAALQQQIANAGTLVCRSGYSSLMDLLPYNKRLVMVPTPGQTEQEYLAQLHHNPAAGRIAVSQRDFVHPSGGTRRVAPDGWL